MSEIKKTNKRECSIQFKKQKLFLSASAGEGLGSQVDIYERGGVLALVNADAGALHPIKNSSRSTRKDISCQSLYDYLVDKFDLHEEEKLTAWHDATGILLFGLAQNDREANHPFDGSFRKLELPLEQFENCTVFIDHGVLMLSRAAAKHFTEHANIFECGGVLCLENAPDGALQVDPRPHSSKGIASEDLIAYIRKKFAASGGRLPARVCDGRVYFSETHPKKDQDFTQFKPLEFVMTGPQIWVTLMKNGVLRVSALAAGGLNSGVEIRRCGDVVALVPSDVNRQLPVSRRPDKGGVTISSEALRQRLKELFACDDGVRFFTKLCGNLVCFSNRSLDGDTLDPAQFQEDLLDKRVRQFVSLSSSDLYLSRGLGDCLVGRFDVCRFGTVFALVENTAGAFFTANKQRSIVNGVLGEYLQRELGISGRARLFAKTFYGGVMFATSSDGLAAITAQSLFQRVPPSAFLAVQHQMIHRRPRHPSGRRPSHQNSVQVATGI